MAQKKENRPWELLGVVATINEVPRETAKSLHLTKQSRLSVKMMTEDANVIVTDLGNVIGTKIVLTIEEALVVEEQAIRTAEIYTEVFLRPNGSIISVPQDAQY